jgi:hypothetical protein
MARSLTGSLMLVALSTMIMSCSPGYAKTAKLPSLQDKQEQLMSAINQAQLTHGLTDKEARGLRSGLADVAHKKAKIKGKKGKLAPEDEEKLQNDLNVISETINKKKLDKKLHPEVQAKAQAKELESKKAASEGKAKARAEDLAKAHSKENKAQVKVDKVQAQDDSAKKK